MTGQPTASAADFLPARIHLKSLREAAAHFRGCDLYCQAAQTVFGEGLRRAEAVLVGEQPGDQEDRQGRPFVGPAGRLLRQAVRDASLDPKQPYITNAVKHFKWELRGKRRIHKKPSEREINACNAWFDAELRVIAPRVAVGLGATATRALFGTTLRLRDYRGQFHRSPLHSATFVTEHPSAVLRLKSVSARDYRRAYDHFVRDLSMVADRLRQQD